VGNRALTELHTPGPASKGYALGWDTDGQATDPTRLEHTGSLATYSAYMEVVPDSGYGVVLLLNAGSGLLLDQMGIFYGVRDIVEGTDTTPSGPAGATLSATRLDLILGVLTVVVLLLGIRGVVRAGPWARRRRQQHWTRTALRTAPYVAVVAVVAAYPQLAERLLLGGRDVTWVAAGYGWPALTALILSVLLASLATLAARTWHVVRTRRHDPLETATRAGRQTVGIG
jgi:hypothetical protein